MDVARPALLDAIARVVAAVSLFSDLLARYHAVRSLDLEGPVGFAMPNLPEVGDEEPWATPGVLRRAIRFLHNRGLVTDEEFENMSVEARRIGLGVADQSDKRLLEIVRNSLADSYASGADIDAATLDMQTALAADGFEPLRPWHARLVAQMTHANAYGFAQRQMLTDLRVHKLMPLARYRHDPAVVTPRPAHLALDGHIFDPRGPEAAQLHTPGGFGCQCSWEGIPAEEAAKLKPSEWPKDDDGNPVQALEGGFRPEDLAAGIDAREARLRAQLSPEMLKYLPTDWKVLAVN